MGYAVKLQKGGELIEEFVSLAPFKAYDIKGNEITSQYITNFTRGVGNYAQFNVIKEFTYTGASGNSGSQKAVALEHLTVGTWIMAGTYGYVYKGYTSCGLYLDFGYGAGAAGLMIYKS